MTAQLPPPANRGQSAPRMNGVAIAPLSYCIVIYHFGYWRKSVPASNQWVITVVAEGDHCPFDIVADFLEDLRVRGDYTIISNVTTPASGISGAKSSRNDNDNLRTFGEITGSDDGHYGDDGAARLDGHDYTIYAGLGYGARG